jgi:hypothetical protein
VLAAAVVTFLLPAGARDVVFRTPLLILVLIVGTAARPVADHATARLRRR